MVKNPRIAPVPLTSARKPMRRRSSVPAARGEDAAGAGDLYLCLKVFDAQRRRIAFEDSLAVFRDSINFLPDLFDGFGVPERAASHIQMRQCPRDTVVKYGRAVLVLL